jgi:hypothetical protein
VAMIAPSDIRRRPCMGRSMRLFDRLVNPNNIDLTP